MSPILVIARHEFRSLAAKPAFIFTYLFATVFVLGISFFLGGVGPRNGEVESIGAGMLVGTMFFMVTMTSVGHLLQAVLEEKTSRVVEILLSKVSSEELLWGKVLGVGSVAAAQVGSWVVLGSVASLVGSRLLGQGSFTVPLLTTLLMLLFGVCGYLMFAALISAGGSLANDMKEAQSMTMLVMFSVMVPWQMGMFFAMNPINGAQRLVSLIPITAPTAMIIRLGQGPVPAWEVGLSLALVAGLAWLSLRLGATAFDLGLLSAGRRFSWKMVIETYMSRRRL